ncbi:hypothetical protein Tfer_2772 [Thermincola ferriacetica]|uniref:TrbL/VirB6 plasmid conjugal transfer protein n=1 Tax=Thermincola ferriacetica TaxID=281456 RepID=A0A0L6W0S0_9FIRM|nr:hypothetical protein [Thermincola ferriacetica]KNZ68679.1 hypothetical protein Tfer_2772 [Thermincola ferriacetica]
MLRMQKTITLALILTVLVMALVPAMVYAAGEDQQQKQLSKQPLEDKGSLGESFIATIINGLVAPLEWLGEVGGIQTLDKLIYDASGDADVSPLTAGEWATAQKWYVGIAGATMSLLIISVFYTFIKTAAYAAYNPAARAGLAQDVGRWFIALVLVAAIPYLFMVFSGLNTAFVDTIQGVARNVSGAEAVRQLGDYGAGGSFISGLHTGSILGTAIAKLVLLGIQAWINFLFKIRKIMLIIMLVFAPVAVYLWSIRGEPQPLSVLFGELASNFFMQTAYALVFSVFLSFVNLAEATWIDVIVWLFMITSIAEVIRNVLQSLVSRWSGVNEAGIAGRALAFAGGGALMGMSQVLRGNKQAMADFNKMPKPEGMAGAGGSGSLGGGTADFSGSPAMGTLYRSSYNAAKWGGVMAAGVSTAGAAAGSLVTAAVPGGEHLGVMAGQAAGAITGGIIRGVGTSAGLARKTWFNSRAYGTNLAGGLQKATGTASTPQALFRAGRIVAQNTFSPAGMPGLLQKYGASGAAAENQVPATWRQSNEPPPGGGSSGGSGLDRSMAPVSFAGNSGPEGIGGTYSGESETGSMPGPGQVPAAQEKTFKPKQNDFSLDNLE